MMIHRIRTLVLALVALSACSHAPAFGQTVRWEHPPPDCNLAERKTDGGITLRRYEWHAGRVIVSTVAAEALHRATHAPRWASAIVATVGLSLLPHIVNGAIRRVYPINPMDWAFDLFNGAAPVILWTGASGGNWQSRALAASTEVAGYAALSCYASP